MQDLRCDIDVISVFTCGALQMFKTMNEIYKICVLKCLHKSGVTKLMSFSTKNLPGVTSVTLV